MAKEFDVLKEQANVIKNEVEDGANTASRVGGMFEDIVDRMQYGVTEVNVSQLYPTDGTDGSNKYTLETAIAKVGEELRHAGLKVTFLNEEGTTETWEYRGGTFTSSSSWEQGGAGRIEELQRLGYLFAGVATPTTNPGAPDGNVFYLATEAGIYANFNGIEIVSGEAVILEWRGSWVKKTIGFATQESLTDLLSGTIYAVPFTTDGYYKGGGTEFEGVIQKCITTLNSSKSSYKEMEAEIYRTYITYYHKNTKDNFREEIIYADFNFRGLGTGQYRNVAIFNQSDKLIYQGRSRGQMLFLLPQNHTIYLSASNWNVTPKFDVSTITREQYILNVSRSLIKKGIGNSDNYNLSQNFINSLDKHFVIDYIPPFSISEIGTPVETKIEHYCPNEFTQLSDFESKEEGSPVYPFTTYIYKNEGNEISFVYANFLNNAQYSPTLGKYMKNGLYDADDNLIRSSVKDGSLLFAVLPGYTLVIAGESKNFTTVPTIISRTNRYYNAENFVRDYTRAFVRSSKYLLGNYLNTSLLSGITEIKSGNTIDVQWENVVYPKEVNKYAYITQSPSEIIFERYGNYKFYLKNTGDSELTIKIGITRGSYDWSKGYIASKVITIGAGEELIENISYEDWQSNGFFDYGINTYMHVVLYDGESSSGVNAINKTGSLSIKMLYCDTADNAINADKSNNSKNAGWHIGCYSDDAVFRDAYPSGGVPNAMTIEKIDDRTIHLITNISEEEVGSKYRGVYWKVNYQNFEEIKGIWKLSNTYSGYDGYVKINSSVKDWGPTESDVVNLTSPSNGGAEWNLYDLIMAYKEAHQDDGKWTGRLMTQGYFYIQILTYNPSGLLAPFEDTLTIDHIPEDTKVIATDFSSEAEEKIKKVVAGYRLKTQVTNWGDSLTAGAGSSNHTNQKTVLDAIKNKGYEALDLTESDRITYSIMMQKLLGNNYSVTNCGVGGENINTIAARLGANIAYANNDFVLSQDTTPVQIGDNSSKLKSSWGATVSPLLQGAGNSVNPCYVQGIECTLKWTGSSYNDPNGVYTLQRVSGGDRTISFSAKTPIIMSGSKLYRNTKIAVLWCWQNGGYSTDNELIEKLDKMIAHISTSNYLIIGLHSGTSESRSAQEEALTKKYGDKFFNWREYVSTNALYDFGISPTEEDEAEMLKGSIPKSLLIDSVHLCAAGYAILGFKIVERFKNLGYIE